MSTLILPVAGRSSRFPGMRPKWLLTMPDGKLMIEKSVEALDHNCFSRVVVTALSEHVDKYLSNGGMEDIIKSIGHKNTSFCCLEHPTSSQSETIAQAIRKANITGPIYIKDCDNQFEYKFGGENEISVLSLDKVGLIDAKNKSYILADSLGNVKNIVEKQVISNTFCCGGYGFKDSELFLKYYESIRQQGEIYISHVIYKMLLDGVNFVGNEAAQYIDWGTLREYRHYTRSFITMFCDVDGVLFYNGSKFGPTGWVTDPIVDNLKTIARLQDQSRLYLVITSCRPETEIQYLKDRLAEYGVVPQKFVMGLPHSKRILVNDFSATNPYPSAMSVNLERDSKLLSSILDSVIE